MKACSRWILTLFVGVNAFIVLLLVRDVSIHPKFSTGILRTSNRTFPHETTRQRYVRNIQACVQPDLHPFDSHVLKFVKKEKGIECSGQGGWINVINGNLEFKIPPNYPPGVVKCFIRYIKRYRDFVIYFEEEVELPLSKKSKLKHDHFKLICKLNATIVHDRLYTTIVKQDVMGPEVTGNTSHPKFDVFILGFDSVSRMSFKRNLPKSYEFFTKTMNSHIMTGYNIVGDGTFRNMLPFFTGKQENELPVTRKHSINPKFVDIYPMVWKKYKERGYVTGFAEDCAYIGTFAYRKTGFNRIPTDHYMRPFYLAVEQLEKSDPKQYKQFCIGPRKRVDIFFDYLKQFWSVYKNSPKFMFSFHSEQSHSDNINLAGTLDSDLLALLQYIKYSPLYTNTIFILMSDHGSRFSGLRETLQGKQEERLPFFGISLPLSFEKSYPNIIRNLKVNTERLTSPFDIHATLEQILSNNAAIKPLQRGLSIFNEIPLSRTCKSAGIFEHWCACLNWIKINISEEIVKTSANKIIKHINKVLEGNLNVCHLVSLHNVTRAMKLAPEIKLLKFYKSLDDDKLNESFNDNTAIQQTKYQIWIITHPGHALYEVTLTHFESNNSIIINTDDISRLNRYGQTANCIAGDDFQDIRKFCYCTHKKL